MAEVPRFVDQYERLDIPSLPLTRRFDDPRVVNRIQRYFADIAQSLGMNHLMTSEYLSIETDIDLQPKPSRSFALYESLRFKDEQVLATAVRKVGAGVVRRAFVTKEPLELGTIAMLTDLHQADDHLTEILFKR